MDRRSRAVSAFTRDVPKTRTLPELNGLFNTFVRLFGFTAYAVGYAPGQPVGDEPFFLLDWPRAWLELYAREGFAAEDAVVASASIATAPFTWSELQRTRPGASARIFAAARGFGWGDGLLVPLRIEDGSSTARLGVVSLAAPTLDGLGAGDLSSVAEGSALALLRAVALSGRREPADLSERERQTLELVASGRGDREIGGILGITTATAHWHVEQAKKKLGAITRAQAVALAVARNVVTPGSARAP